MARPARKPLNTAMPPMRAQRDELRLLGDRLCAWEPISRGRLEGRIALPHLRGALVDAGRLPDQHLIDSLLAEWFGPARWRIEQQEVDGRLVDVVLREEPPLPRGIGPGGRRG